ncbi:MAG: tetraacyldisaccharide 4'-kinase [Alphaproteobacteria bacterium]|nr:tetraacyldisaccharide 4'-kinase [Alphaproteobacteria bacterium]
MKQSGWLRVWSNRCGWALVLWPLSQIYRALLLGRRWLYDSGLLKTRRLPVPLLVVGNVMVGGVGKTPITMTLVEQLSRLGWRVGVISRGYGRESDQTQLVQTDSTEKQVGDEPLLIARRTGVPVAVSTRRWDAAVALLAQHPEVDLLISDDGLQHWAVQADLALCVFDARRLGNGWLLPAGPLREPWPLQGRHRPCTWVLSSEDPPWEGSWSVRRSLAPEAINGLGERCPLKQLPSPVHALAAIAQPHVFFDALRAWGVRLDQTQSRGDHQDLSAWHPQPPGTWVCTEKDAVKIWRQYPQVWAAPLQVSLPEALIQQITLALRSKLSSPHGH